MPSKCVLILLDGLGDRSYDALGHQTPLQAAHTPALNKLAAMGANGLYHAAALGQALPSENAHFAIFGYDMAEFPGRGALEALGAGIDIGLRDVAVLAHLVSVHAESGCLVLEKDRPEASIEEAKALIEAVGKYESSGVKIRFTPTKGLFGIVTLSGDVAPFVTDTDPMLEGRPLSEVKPWLDHDGDPAARNTAEILKEYLLWAHRGLQRHPVNLERTKKGIVPINGLVTQRAGRLKSVPPLGERYGLKGLSIASGVIYWGLGAYLGLHCRKVTDSGDPAQDMSERLTLAREALGVYDFVHVHTKAPDEAAHKKNPHRKKAVIEALSHGIGQAIEPLINDPEVLLIIMADHSTPSSGPLIHSGEPVPLIFCGRGVRRDAVQRFDEISPAAGALGCVRGKELMYLILNHLDRAKLMGIMDTPVDQPFWPGRYEPFRIEPDG